MRLLATTSLGRIVFTQSALPAIRPATHILDGDEIIIRTPHDTALAAQAQPTSSPTMVVAYHTDAIDLKTHQGWSMAAIGYIHLITDPQKLSAT